MSLELEVNKVKKQDTGHKLRPITPNALLRDKIDRLRDRLTKNSDSEVIALADECHRLIYFLDDYIEANTTEPSENLQNLEKETNDIDWDTAFEESDTDIALEREMLSGAVEGQFLKMLVSISKAKRILEIGSFTGYASLAMAEALPNDGELIALEYDAFTARFAREQVAKSEHGSKIEVKIGDAIASLRSIDTNEKPFDLVFIDADKTGYLDYYNFLMDSDLVPVGGLICVDNTLLMGEAYQAHPASDNGKAIQKFNEHVSRDGRVEQVLLPLRDGVTLIRRIG